MGLAGLFWQSEEKRLRAPFRILAAFVFVLLSAQIVVTLLTLLDSVVSLPGALVTALGLGLMTVSIVAVAWFVDRRVLRDVGLGLDGQWGRDAVAGFGVGLGMAAVIVVVLRAAGMATLVGTRQGVPDLLLGGGSPAVSLLYGLAFFVAVGALEEVLVRGYLLVNVAEGIRGYLPDDRTAVLVAVVGTALLFGALHAANPGGTTLGLVNITLAGLLLGGTYVATGRLAFPIGVHVAWNFGLGPVFGLPVSGLITDTALVPVRIEGSPLVTGGAFGPEGGLVMLVALAYAAVAAAWWIHRQYDQVAVHEHIAVPDLWVDDDAET